MSEVRGGAYSCGLFDGVKNVTVHLLSNFNQLHMRERERERKREREREREREGRGRIAG